MSNLPSVSFWYLRHGQTDWNKDNLAQGSIDVPLNALGLEQAEAAAAALAGRDIASIACSPLVRARVTAEVVGAKLGLPVRVFEGLREADFGSMERQPMLAAWFTDWIEGTATPAGAEPFADVVARAVGGVVEVLGVQAAPCLIVGHGAFFRGLRSAMGLAPNERLPNAAPMHCTPAIPWRIAALS